MRRGVEWRQEQRKLPGEGAQRLKGARYPWLGNPENMDRQRWKEFAALRDSVSSAGGTVPAATATPSLL